MPYAQALEERHRYNFITRFFHAMRFKRVVHYVRTMEKSLGRPPVVMDIGCGPGNVFFALNEAAHVRYVGVELNAAKVEKGNAALAGYENAIILNRDASVSGLFEEVEPDIVIALESFEHIPPASVEKIIDTVSGYQGLSLFICSVPVEIGPAIWIKNAGSALIGYKRHREYSWAETFWAGLYRLDKLPAHDLRHKGFDWRWLSNALRRKLKVVKVHTSPWDIIPAAFSPSILFVSVADKS